MPQMASSMCHKSRLASTPRHIFSPLSKFRTHDHLAMHTLSDLSNHFSRLSGCFLSVRGLAVMNPTGLSGLASKISSLGISCGRSSWQIVSNTDCFLPFPIIPPSQNPPPYLHGPRHICLCEAFCSFRQMGTQDSALGGVRCCASALAISCSLLAIS